MVASAFGGIGGQLRYVFVAFLAAMACSSVAHADIYRWTDKDGNVNYSDEAPPREQRTKDLVVVTRSKPAAQVAAATQQDLLARIQNLEQQLQTQQISAPLLQGVPPPVAVYHAPPMPTPQPYYQAPPAQPVTYYDSGYDAGAYDSTLSYAPFLSSVVPVYVVSTIRGRGGRPAFGHRTPGRGPVHGAPRGGRSGGRR